MIVLVLVVVRAGTLLFGVSATCWRRYAEDRLKMTGVASILRTGVKTILSRRNYRTKPRGFNPGNTSKNDPERAADDSLRHVHLPGG
jgi:hypothetical protein